MKKRTTLFGVPLHAIVQANPIYLLFLDDLSNELFLIHQRAELQFQKHMSLSYHISDMFWVHNHIFSLNYILLLWYTPLHHIYIYDE